MKSYEFTLVLERKYWGRTELKDRAILEPLNLEKNQKKIKLMIRKKQRSDIKEFEIILLRNQTYLFTLWPCAVSPWVTFLAYVWLPLLTLLSWFCLSILFYYCFDSWLILLLVISVWLDIAFSHLWGCLLAWQQTFSASITRIYLVQGSNGKKFKTSIFSFFKY